MTKTTLHTTRTAALLIMLLLFFTGTVRAQTITVEHYVNLCRQHALYGDDIPARIACGSALQLDPTVDEAGRIIAKLDIDNRNLLAATARLDRMQRERPHSDNLVLLAQVAIQNEDVAAVRKYLQDI